MDSNLSARAPLMPGSRVIHIDPASVRRRKNENGGLLNRFSKWGHYKSQKSSSSWTSSTSQEAGRQLNRRPSVRRTDFTNAKEYNQHRNQKRFIFHRGFFRRNGNSSSRSDNRIRLKNRAELNSALQYIDFSTFTPSDIIGNGKVANFSPIKLRQRTATVVLSSLAVANDYSRSLGRSVSIKRALPPAGKSRNTSRTSSLRRSPPRAPPSSTRSLRQKKSSSLPSSMPSSLPSPFHNPVLRNMWKEYMLLVVFQRLRLRMALLRDLSSKSITSSGESSSTSYIVTSRKAQ